MRTRHPISEKLVAIRGALGKTQPEFAEMLGVSPVTLARYETSSPPRGSTLLKLAEIADKNSRGDLAQEFRYSFWKEVEAEHGSLKGYVQFRFSRQHGDGGYIFELLNTPQEYAYAQAFQNGLNALRNGDRQAAKQLRALVDAFIPDSERAFFEKVLKEKQ